MKILGYKKFCFEYNKSMDVDMEVIYKDINLLADCSLITLKNGFMNCGQMNFRF